MKRAAVTFVVTIGLAASLSGCTGGSAPESSPAAEDCTPAASGKVSDAVKATGDFGTLPIVVFHSPTKVKKTQRTVAIEGDGDVVRDGDSVNVQYSIFNGETGVNIAGTDYTEATLSAFPLDAQLLPGFQKTLECSTIGSRVVGVIPAADAFGDSGEEQLGIKPGEDVVFVADIVSIKPPADPPLPKADGEEQPAPEGFPTVKLADNGQPKVTIPDSDPPAELEVALLKKGDGKKIEPNSDVVVHYQGVNWTSKEVFDESWAQGTPATFNTGQVVAGFKKALEGQKVGSQVIAIIPPAEGYGDAGQPSAGIAGTDTLVFVIDILGIG